MTRCRLLSYGHLKFFTLGPDIGHRTRQVILYSVQCCYAVHWTDKKVLNIAGSGSCRLALEEHDPQVKRYVQCTARARPPPLWRCLRLFVLVAKTRQCLLTCNCYVLLYGEIK